MSPPLVCLPNPSLEDYIELLSFEPEGDVPLQPIPLACPSLIPNISSLFSQSNSEAGVDGNITSFFDELNLKKRKLEEDMKEDYTRKRHGRKLVILYRSGVGLLGRLQGSKGVEEVGHIMGKVGDLALFWNHDVKVDIVLDKTMFWDVVEAIVTVAPGPLCLFGD
ncbi:hypothetical protein Ancab_001132 [Ancistrocladus abbreviatus]